MFRKRYHLSVLAVAGLTLGLLSACSDGDDHDEPPPAPTVATQPLQPDDGPGGKDYPYTQVRADQYGIGATAYWLFEPADSGTTALPLVYFLHGFSATEPLPYLAWIDHLVRRGAVVVYPLYQSSELTPMDRYMPNTLTALQSAMAELSQPGHALVDYERGVAVGHSMGGAIAANLAAVAASHGLPQPHALFSINSCNYYVADPDIQMPLEDLSRIPAGTLLLAMAGADDALAGAATTRRIYLESTAVTAADKDYLTVYSDAHGEPALSADHVAALAGTGDGVVATPDALDFYGHWKLLDALMSAAFEDRDREYALGGTPQQRSLGEWSDGTEVRPLVVTDSP